MTVKGFLSILLRNDPNDIAELAIRRYVKEVSRNNPVDIALNEKKI